MSSKFWWISTRASPDLPTGFIYQIHCGIYGPSKICHGCHESWVMSDDDISFKLFECMTSKSEHLRTSWTKLSMSSGRKPPTSRNFQRITKVNDLDHARKPTRGPCRSTIHAFGKPNDADCLMLRNSLSNGIQKLHAENHTAMNLWSWIFRTAKSARVSWAKRIRGYQYIHCLCYVCLCIHVTLVTNKKVISFPSKHLFHIGIPWLSILELINQGSFFSTSGAMYNKVPACAVTAWLISDAYSDQPRPWKIDNDMIYHDITIYHVCYLRQPWTALFRNTINTLDHHVSTLCLDSTVTVAIAALIEREREREERVVCPKAANSNARSNSKKVTYSTCMIMKQFLAILQHMHNPQTAQCTN